MNRTPIKLSPIWMAAVVVILSSSCGDRGDVSAVLAASPESYIEAELLRLEEVYHLEYGDIYAKSFYMLGKICEQRGERTLANENYRKFLDIWKDADAGIIEVEDPRKRLAGLKGS